MAQLGKISSKTETKSSSAKVYDFMKNKMTSLSSINPQLLKRAELIEGEAGKVGSVKLFEYVMGGKMMTAKVKTVKVDDEGRTLGYDIIEGEALELYPTFKSNLTVNEGCVNWSLEFERANESVPNPDSYLMLADGLIKTLDAYIASH